MSVERILRGGRIAAERGSYEASIAIDDGTIVAIGQFESLPAAEEVTDVRGLVVLPGLIDTHAHFREPGFTHKEDFDTGTKAAARGGITLAVDMPNCDPPTNSLRRFEEKRALAAEKSRIDFSHNPSGDTPDEIRRFAEAGALAIKQFMIADTERGYPHMPSLGISDRGHLLEIFERAGEVDLPLMVHPHSQKVSEYLQEEVWEEHGKGPTAYMEWFRKKDFLFMNEAISTLIQFAESTGTHVHVLHVGWKRAIEDLTHARERKDLDLTIEINPFQLFLSWEEIERDLGPYGLGFAIPGDDQNHAWEALRDGTIDVIGSDHAPHTVAEKEGGWENTWEAQTGVPQIEFYVPLLLDAVNEDRLSLGRLVDVCSRNPARIFGVYPTKGSVQPGSHADFTVVDMDRTWTISNDEVFSKCGYTPFDGRDVTGDVVETIVRGETVMEDGRIVGEPGFGEFVGSHG